MSWFSNMEGYGQNGADPFLFLLVAVGQPPVRRGVAEVHVAVFQELRADFDGVRRPGMRVLPGQSDLGYGRVVDGVLRVVISSENDGRLDFQRFDRRGHNQVKHF